MLTGMLTSEAEILRRAEAWGRSGRGVAIATVVETSGSAPRPVGSHLIVNDAGLFHGSVSSGCVEGEVVTAALDVIEGGGPRLLTFGVADETAWRVGLTCGGRISVHVEKLDAARLALLARMDREYSARRLCALATPLNGGTPWLIAADGEAPAGLVDPLRACVQSARSALVRQGDGQLFVYAHRPPTRLIIVGAVHVAQALAPMARLAGFDVALVDPREAFANAERFPGCLVFAGWPDEVFPKIGLDAFTAVAVFSHDPKIDDLALRLALASDCFYVGALGSMASHARRRERLAAMGVESLAFDRLHAPIGLDIGAVSPAEIAIAVLGEMTLERRQKPPRQCGLRDASP
jgi:xanthine dehydrogenase accessory factor